MKTLFELIGLILFFGVFIPELISSLILGWYVFKSPFDVSEVFSLNKHNKDILMAKKANTFIMPISPRTFLSKYYIVDKGKVFRWSKLHTRIEVMYKTFEEHARH